MPFYRQETENLRTTECYGISAKRAKRVARCRMDIQVRWQSKGHGSTLAVVEGGEGFDADKLRSLLPEPPFQKMIGILEIISKTPNQRHIYDSLQRAARDKAWEISAAKREAMLAGHEKGLRIGCAGQIRLLEQFLNLPQVSDEQLAGLTLTELEGLVADLKARLNSRGNS